MEDEYLNKQIQDILGEEMQKDNLNLTALNFDTMDWFCDDLFESMQVCAIL